jgi:hypothetical protein
MKLKILRSTLALTALGLAAGAYAQTPAPSTPAPAPTELVYLQQLPTVASLMNTAKAQGVTVLKISQTSTEVDAVYQAPNGQTNTVSYQVLPAGEGAAPAAVPAPGTAGTTVVYQTTAPGPAPAYYYDPYYYGGYYPWGWYAPVGIRLGFGFGGGWRGGWRR